MLERGCDLKGTAEVSDLEYGMDFRDIEFRREVFLRFYQFHLKNRAHPGGVYFIFPYLADKYNWSMEQKLWFAYLNGCTQHPMTTLTIFREFPTLPRSSSEVEAFTNWNNSIWEKLIVDSDKKYQKGKIPQMLPSYLASLGGLSQEDYFRNKLGNADPKKHFRKVWDSVIGGFEGFGRLSTFSYLEYLQIMGIPFEYDSFFMDDLSGSKSHRNGMLKVLGRDDLDWWDKLNPNLKTHTPEITEWAEKEAWSLLEEAQDRFRYEDYIKDVGPQTLESTLCCYKSWHRPDRRYPGVYLDMMYQRIKNTEEVWGNTQDFSVFWEMREKCLPERLLLEKNPRDPTHNRSKSLSKEKQNHYRLTGQPIMMSQDFPEFRNDFEDKYYGEEKEEDFFR